MMIGLFAIRCVAGAVQATVRSAGEALGVISTRTPRARPAQRRLPTRTAQLTRTPKPIEKPRPAATSRAALTAEDALARTAEAQQAVAPQPSPVPIVRATDVTEPPPSKVLAAPSTEAPAQADPAGKPPQGSDCPVGYPVKGNQSRIYHTPSSRYYSRTKPEWCFATVADAEAAGFRAPER